MDTLSTVPIEIRRFADYVDNHLENVANNIREALSSSQWLPESARPSPPPPPPRAFRVPMPSSSSSIYAQVQRWILKNKILTAVIVITVGGAIYHVIRRNSKSKKRRAKRASNGARLEVVVVAGSPSEPITRSIAQDLERRGFVVYIVCNTIEEEVLVQNESRPDIKPLMVDILDPSSARASIDRFEAHLRSPHSPFQGAKSHHLTFRSLLLIPSTTYPSSPIAALSPTTVSDLLNTRLLTPILTLQSFLPLLQILPLSHPHSNPNSGPPVKPSVLVLTPSIISSLSPAFHAPESLINSALTSLSSVLSAELSPLKIPVTHLQLGTFDLSAFAPHSRTHAATSSAQRAETLQWEHSTRLAYAKNYVASTSGSSSPSASSLSRVGKGSSLRELNNAVFDAMIYGKGGVVRVGVGSSLYGFVGAWVPRGLVGWMMGVRRVDAKGSRTEFGRGQQPQGLIMDRAEDEDGNVKGFATGDEGKKGCGCGAKHPKGFTHDEDGGYISVYGEQDDEESGKGHGF
ncbi:uncharacterized protein L3040_007640 [Drepanopeziza brunnea f. sp. 'multigermtubi']|uniref:DUF1776-domain-containing protein n=1 Tax=Marssonina brunnea f. sp. multigermtubi (strain MB_m1) TaxID=1072389 RepID=K1WKL8_MARBU|nr:uncharacterized protein MBM_03962 [Drepanopeziza brunnea f. sp. 'multigermtubi' MB_m1]EKD18190.1 hypothetical protein MBM_03962 [Drepanopeziza brunnea f. sp. 'multigermtubi' MB_m1]KAJ5037466.1 hypothetical protein L3040_007640 [Drepanopeziza brunnea f. sp. 'multigermtubi']